jgi:hypothetical protein
MIMPLGFHGFSFDLFAFSRRPQVQIRSVQPATSTADDERRDDKRRDASDVQSDEVSFWGLAAFPVI